MSKCYEVIDNESDEVEHVLCLGLEYYVFQLAGGSVAGQDDLQDLFCRKRRKWNAGGREIVRL